MARLGFLYDQTKCIGCSTCQIACKDKNNLEPGIFFRRTDTLEYVKQGRPVWMHYSGSCNHCKEAACVKSCPTDSMHYMEDGTVGHNPHTCIGCGICTWSCPYHAPKLSRKLGIAMKCDSCADRRSQGLKPACVEACLTHCLDFRDLEELTEAQKEGWECDLEVLPDSSLTCPSLLIRKNRVL
jgi:anaerobic dimethyl sulfoxide reductase subunit B (iron-sulfur subunit)